MTLVSSFILLISIFLDGVVSVLPNFNSSNFMVLTLFLIYPIFLKKKKWYLFLLFISTVSYDILYTNILFFHTTIMFCIYLLMEKNAKTMDFISILKYFLLYHLLVFSLLYIVGYIKNPFILARTLLTGSIANIIYVVFFYLFLSRYYPNHKKKSSSYISFS